MPIKSFSEYRPDLTDYEGQYTRTASNVVPKAEGYGPFGDLNALTSALPATCRGYFFARRSDGSVTIFAATATRIFQLNNSDFSWVPVSKVSALTSISNASPAVFTLTAHGLSVGDAVVLSTSGSLPTGLTVGTVYYVIAAGFTANQFEVSTSPGGTAVNTSSSGSGTHAFTGQYSAVPSADQWQFRQFNNFVFAVQINTAPQVFDITSSTAFADLAGSPPQARYIDIVNRFVLLSGLGSATPYRIQWSGLNATTTWTSGVSQSDFQDLPTGGIVRGVAGGEYGLILQDGAVRRMTYAPGAPYIFQIDIISENNGVLAPLSVVRGGDRVFYIGPDGFKMVVPGGYPVSIGKNKVDATFLADLDKNNLQYCIGAPDPNSTRVYWSYKSLAGLTGFFDKIIIYDYVLDRWSTVTTTGEFIASLAKPGLTLENLDTISSSLDALTFSLDDIAASALPQLSAAGVTHKIGFYTGSTLEAAMETPEQGGEGRRVRVRGFRPVTDAPTVYGSVSKRDTQNATAAYSAENPLDSYGMISANVSTRYARARLRIPYGTAWTYATGVEPETAIEGAR